MHILKAIDYCRIAHYFKMVNLYVICMLLCPLKVICTAVVPKGLCEMISALMNDVGIPTKEVERTCSFLPCKRTCTVPCLKQSLSQTLGLSVPGSQPPARVVMQHFYCL